VVYHRDEIGRATYYSPLNSVNDQNVKRMGLCLGVQARDEIAGLAGNTGRWWDGIM